MQLEKAKQYAETFADQPVKDAVLTVPAYFTQAERRAVLMAAELSGINVLQILGDNAAGRTGQTVQTQIRLLLEEQSDQGLHCLLFHLHHFKKICFRFGLFV